jgi:serine/threonine protein phosphatase 1
MTRYVIGDVHGYYGTLKQLLKLIDVKDEDHVFFVGDLIDRGEKSAKVIRLVRNTKNFFSVVGNHELMMMDAIFNNNLQSWVFNGYGSETYNSYQKLYGEESMKMMFDDCVWMNSLPYFIDLGDYFIVHAGVKPGVPLEKQGEYEFCWIREDFFLSPQRVFPDKTIIVGHTITSSGHFRDVPGGNIILGNGFMMIDTSAYFKASGWLTALDLDNDLVYQVNTDKRQRIGTINDFGTQI